MMKCNVFKFGNTHCRQINGTTIGSVPASDWATMMFNFYEVAIIEPTFRQNLRLDAMLIDEKIGVWSSLQANDYNNYKTAINKM